MEIIELQTTTDPTSGQQISPAIPYSFDKSRIDFGSLTVQGDGSVKAKFRYKISNGVRALPWINTANYTWVFVEETPEQVANATGATGPEVTWNVPNTPTIQYIPPVGPGPSRFVILGSVPNSLWTIDNVDKGTATNSVVTFTPSVSPEASKTYTVARAGSGVLSGVITLDAVATVDGQSTITPITIVIRPENNRDPSGTISSPIGFGDAYFWTVTTNIPCTLELFDEDDGGTGITFAVLPPAGPATSFSIGGQNPSATGEATFSYKLISTDNPLCEVIFASSLTLDCQI